MILPVLIYGSETWVTSKRHFDFLGPFERELLRRIVGPDVRKDDSGDVTIYLEADIVKKIKLGRLRWAGHLARMSEEEPARKILCSALDGKRQCGRPCLRCRDGVDQDTRSLGVRNRIASFSARDRDKWKDLLNQAKARYRLSSR